MRITKLAHGLFFFAALSLGGCAVESGSDSDFPADDSAAADDVTESSESAASIPYCQSQTIAIDHIAQNHVFGEGNLYGHTRAPGDGDVILAKFAKTNSTGWHGAWNNRGDAEDAVREVMGKGCSELTAWAKDAAVNSTLTVTKSTSKKGLACNALRQCYATGAVRIFWKKVGEQVVQTPGGRTKTVQLVVTTGYPYVNK